NVYYVGISTYTLQQPNYFNTGAAHSGTTGRLLGQGALVFMVEIVKVQAAAQIELIITISTGDFQSTATHGDPCDIFCLQFILLKQRLILVFSDGTITQQNVQQLPVSGNGMSGKARPGQAKQDQAQHFS